MHHNEPKSVPAAFIELQHTTNKGSVLQSAVVGALHCSCLGVPFKYNHCVLWYAYITAGQLCEWFLLFPHRLHKYSIEIIIHGSCPDTKHGDLN